MNKVEALSRYNENLLQCKSCDSDYKLLTALSLEYIEVSSKKNSSTRDSKLELLEMILGYLWTAPKYGCDGHCAHCHNCVDITDSLIEIYYMKHKARIESDIEKKEGNSVNR